MREIGRRFTINDQVMSLGKEISNLRVDYQKGQLKDNELLQDPILQFETWMSEAVENGVHEANAMSLATVRADGMPSVRIVLLKGFDERGFVFYTNYESDKSRQLEAHPFAALNFFWAPLEKQVRIEGRVVRVSDEESDEYFHSRDRGSRLGAWASPQSRIIPARETLELRVKAIQEQYPGDTFIPRPAYWGGFRVEPSYMEFWQGRSSRLHDRFAYQRSGSGWDVSRLAP